MISGSKLTQYNGIKQFQSKISRYCSGMIYGELGRYPIVLDVKIRILSFWSKMLFGKESKLSSIIYRLCFEIYTVKVVHKIVQCI
jgi:hypothetical protein